MRLMVDYDFQDYGDGGAFPEIHFAQFPLGMGMGERKGKSEGQIALQYDADGKLRHDAIARIGHDKNKVCLLIQLSPHI